MSFIWGPVEITISGPSTLVDRAMSGARAALSGAPDEKTGEFRQSDSIDPKRQQLRALQVLKDLCDQVGGEGPLGTQIRGKDPGAFAIIKRELKNEELVEMTGTRKWARYRLSALGKEVLTSGEKK